MWYWLIFGPIAVIFFFASVRMIKQYQRGVLLRAGKLQKVKEPGITFIVPGLDRLLRVDMRTITLEVPAQDIITKDNVSVRVSAVVYFKVVDPIKATIEVEDYETATLQLAQTTLRSVCGQDELDHLLTERDAINQKIQGILAQETEPWGVQVGRVEIKQVDLPESMQRAMARQAEAERERRAAIINADGELQAAAKLTEAARMISADPMAIQLRYLQTIREIGVSDKNTTIIPIPMDLVRNLFGNHSQE